MVRFMETESRRVAARVLGEGAGSSVMGINLQFCKTKESPGDWLHYRGNVLNITELYINSG